MMTETPAKYTAPKTVNTVFGRGYVVANQPAMNGNIMVTFLRKELTAEQWGAVTRHNHLFRDYGNYSRLIKPDQIIQESESEE